MSDAAPKIRFEAVTRTFVLRNDRNGPPVLAALGGVDLEVHDGELLCVVGPSGCGKSTLLDLLAGLTVPTSGRVLLNGTPVEGPGLDRAIVFQQYALLPWRTAQGNVELGLEAKGVPKRQRAAKAREHLHLVGLEGFENRHPHELSGGMKQRVAIARSLAFEPDVLLMDEPFAALDAQTRETLQAELLRIWADTGTTIVFVTHGIEEAVYLGQRVAVMTPRPGRIKAIVDIGVDAGGATALAAGQADLDDDVRSRPAFGHYRHRIWELLHDDTRKPSLTTRTDEPRSLEVSSVG
jgi:NitT/TauT family transport system ATP-binding protein